MNGSFEASGKVQIVYYIWEREQVFIERAMGEMRPVSLALFQTLQVWRKTNPAFHLLCLSQGPGDTG